MNESNVGIVLSGGGVRGMAHIGVLKALEEAEIFPNHVSGASAGALVGAFYAAGYKADEILAFFHETSLFSINNYARRKPGIIDTDKFHRIFIKYFPDDSFKSLERRFFVAVCDILAGETRFFQEGQLINPVLASAAFPVVLSPMVIDNVVYADGGITNNFPVEPLLDRCDRIIGVYSNPLARITAEELTSSMSVMNRAFEVSRANVSIQKFDQCDLVISPEKLADIQTFGMSQIDKAYEIGYSETKGRIEEILSLV